MEGAGESNNNIKVLPRGLEDEDSSFSSFRSSLRARRDRLAKREALLEQTAAKDGSKVTSVTDNSPTATTPSVSTYTPTTRYSTTRRSRLANEYSQPKVDTNDDETALSLITSSKILSMDDSAIRGSRSLSASNSATDLNKVSPELDNPSDSAEVKIASTKVATEGESGAMHNMRKSLPANTRSRRSRRELEVEDMRTRTPSRELIYSDISSLINGESSVGAPNDTKTGNAVMVNGSISNGPENGSISTLVNGTSSRSHVASHRRSMIDEPDSVAASITPPVILIEDRARSNSDVNGMDPEKPSIERRASGSTTISTGAVPGETREERIARYKEMRKAALAARTTQYLDNGAEDTAPPVSGYVPRYLRNRDSSGASNDRNRDDDGGSGCVPRWRRRNDDNDIASSSNASSMTDLHVTRKDSSASSENSNENGPCKLTYENLKLHDKLSSTAPPYSSLSRLEESPTIAPKSVEGITQPKTVEEGNEYNRHSHRKESTNDITPTNSPALASKVASRATNKNSTANHSFNFDYKTVDPLSERRSKKREGLQSTESGTVKDNRKTSAMSDREKQETLTKSVDNVTEITSNKAQNLPKAPSSISDTSDMAQQFDMPARRGSMGLSDRLKKFEGSAETTATSKAASKPGKLDISRFSRQSSTEVLSPSRSAVDISRSHRRSDESVDQKNSVDTKLPNSVGQDISSHPTEKVERRKPNSLLNKKEPRPTSLISDEPLLDPQLAAMLEARKIKAGESPAPVKETATKNEVADVTSILKSRMKKREELDGKKSTISVAARASFFKEEQKRVTEVPASKQTPLDRHPSAKIPQVDKKDAEAKRAIGAKRATLSKKRQRAATQPVTTNELFAAKLLGESNHHEKTQDDLELVSTRPFRGRLLSVPSTYNEMREIKNHSPPQKYVRPKEPKPVVKTVEKKTRTSRPISVKNVTAKVDSGKSPLNRASFTRSSVRARPEAVDSKVTPPSKGVADSKTPDQPNSFVRRSASVRVSGSAGNSVKAAAERAHALVESRKTSTPTSFKKVASKVGDSIRARATARVDSRRASANSPQGNVGSVKRLTVKVTDTQASSSTTESCPLSPASTVSITDKHNVDTPIRPRKLSASTVNSEDIPNYMRRMAAAQQKDRLHTPVSIDSEELFYHPKRKSGSMSYIDSGQQPSYMKPTNRLEAKLDDFAQTSDRDSVDSKPKSKPVSVIEQETGAQPSFMRPTTSSTKRVERHEFDDGKPRPKRAVSPSLPDGDLPSYMKATESYFKKVEHLFDEEEPAKPAKRLSVTKPIHEDELPSFMKPTKAFEALVAIPIEVTAPESKPKRKSTVTEPAANGEIPSYMKPTKSFDKHIADDQSHFTEDKKYKSNSAAKLAAKSPSPHISATHSENGDVPSFRKQTRSHDHKGQSAVHTDEPKTENRRSSQHKLSNGDIPSFMKPTKSFEIKDRCNEEAMVQQEQQEPERKVSVAKKPRASIVEGEVPSYMKTTKSHDIREQAIAGGVSEPSAFDLALEGPMIDQAVEPVPVVTKSRKTSVGGFLRKKFGIGKGTSVDSVSSSNTETSTKKTRKTSSSKTSSQAASTAASKTSSGSAAAGGDLPSYMKPTSNSSQRKLSESVTDEGEINSMMSTVTMAPPCVNGSGHSEGKTPLINVAQVSIDGQDHHVPLRPKKTPTKTKGKDEPDNTTPRSSIANRLASLQVNGEEGWKRRVGEKDHSSFRSGTIHDRLSKITDNSKSWQKKKGQENDAKQFTVEGKMAVKGDIKVAPSPLMPRKEKTGGSAVKRANSLRLKREDVRTPTKTARAVSVMTPKAKGEAKVTETTVVIVPDQDDAEDFFAPTSTQENIEVTAEDFDHIFVESANLLPSISKIKPKRNRASNSPNPYKALQMRADIKSEYTETKSDIADIELKRVNKAKVAEKATRTALAGLATKEDINKISLKKANHGQVMNPGGISAAPFNDLMLIQIKGRRHVEMRLVNPCAKSVNSGDCFLLVTKSKIYQWMGELANLMERSKAADLAAYIFAKKDLGCTGAKSVTVIEEARQVGSHGNDFWKLLGGSSSYSSSGPVEEDELYEDYMAETNSVYRVSGDDLKPVEEYCGQIPRYDMLDDEQVLVFDFGTELYAWCGKLASMDQRKAGLKLAKLLYQSGYDYTGCDINPISPLTLPDKGGLPKKSDKRPDWSICGKVTANMETLLFKEKFFDWPEASRLIQTKDVSNDISSTPAEELKAFDAKNMLERPANPVTLVLEQSNMGRGKSWVEYEDGIRREYQIDTLGVRMWHVSASDYYELMEDSYGQLHCGDTYVVRWQYQIKQSGVRDLKGNLSKYQTQMGRERCAYFFWQGAQSTINEKGASALMTVELDEEHGPQVRVEQGLESSCFLSLFNGHMVTHLGKRDDDAKKTTTKLYVVEHEHENEASLHEVPCQIDCLRSRGVFVLINIKTGLLSLWFGSHAPKNMQSNGRKIASWISEHCPMEVGISLESSITISEIREGAEPKEFLTALRSNNRNKYDSLLNTRTFSEDYVPRLFHMTSVNLVFHVQEVFLPSRNEDYSAFPFVQSQLYKQHQPAIFLLDFGEDVFLWQGWWPLGSQDDENLSTGSARSRYTEDRKLALETSLNYCKARQGRTPNTYCVYAGKEPLSFTNHFPEWEVVEEAVTANSQENRPSTLEDMSQCFKQLSKSVYTFEELQQRPLPDGVNPNRLETYLSDQQFNEVLRMSRAEFAALPGWKQTNIRKESKLF